MGFIPFIPGGPVLGGIVGALGGAALGVFTNWSTMKKIKQENEAMLAALGVQSQDPQIKQILQSGDVGQLIPLMQQDPAQGTAVQQGTTQTDPGQQEAALAAQQQAIQQGQLPATVDPAATAQQSPIPIQATTGQIAVGSGAGAVNPGVGVDPGQAPGTVSQGGGGVTEASAGVDALDPDTAKLTKAQVVELLQKLERQLNDLKAFLAEEERREELDKAAAR